MPQFLAVLDGAPATDQKRPMALPPQLVKALEPHKAKFDSARACGSGTKKWGNGEGSSHNLLQNPACKVDEAGVWIANITVPLRKPKAGPDTSAAGTPSAAAAAAVEAGFCAGTPRHAWYDGAPHFRSRTAWNLLCDLPAKLGLETMDVCHWCQEHGRSLCDSCNGVARREIDKLLNRADSTGKHPVRHVPEIVSELAERRAEVRY
eukprot:gene15468-20580_t